MGIKQILDIQLTAETFRESGEQCGVDTREIGQAHAIGQGSEHVVTMNHANGCADAGRKVIAAPH